MTAAEALIKIVNDNPNGVEGCEECEIMNALCAECVLEKMEELGFKHSLFSRG